MNNYVYEVGNNLYINVTNQCSNDCFFCIRNGHDDMNGTNLWLDKEPTFDDVLAQLPSDLSKYGEIVFCGFGEPTYKIDLLSELGKYFKSKGMTTRLNTNGQANLILVMTWQKNSLVLSTKLTLALTHQTLKNINAFAKVCLAKIRLRQCLSLHINVKTWVWMLICQL